MISSSRVHLKLPSQYATACELAVKFSLIQYGTSFLAWPDWHDARRNLQCLRIGVCNSLPNRSMISWSWDWTSWRHDKVGKLNIQYVKEMCTGRRRSFSFSLPCVVSICFNFYLGRPPPACPPSCCRSSMEPACIGACASCCQ